MKKPWKSEPHGPSLEAFIGAYRIPTGGIETTEELLWHARKLFDLDEHLPRSISVTVEAIESLGKKERSTRAHRNRDMILEILVDMAADKAVQPGKLKPTSREEAPITQSGLQRMMDNSKPDLVDGEPFDVVGELDIDPAQLLRKVVSAVISAGRADILWEFPDVLAFFGSRIPQREEVAHLHNVDQRMFEAADKWPNRKPPA